MKLTQEQIQKYVECGGVFCPYCGSEDIEAQPFDVDETSAWAEVQCLSCGEEWRDIYKLIAIEEVQS